MSLDTFRAALSLADNVTLGGGEPTLHKDFDTMLVESMAMCDEGVFVVTNGSVTRRALVLASLAYDENCKLGAQLSQDIYHDPIDQRVIDAFERIPGGHWGQQAGVRNTTESHDPQPYGRAIELLGLEEEEIERDGTDCMCCDYIVKPNGDIHQCGCPDSPLIGNVWDGTDSPSSECCHSTYFVQECLENDGEYEHLLM